MSSTKKVSKSGKVSVRALKDAKPKKKPVPKAVRMKVWETYIGDKANGQCYACERSLKIDAFEAGHVIAEANGGETNVDNLRVVCKPCNTSCGVKDLDVFKASLKADHIVPLPKAELALQPKPESKYKVIPLDMYTNDIKGRAKAKMMNFFNFVQYDANVADVYDMISGKVILIRERVTKYKNDNNGKPIDLRVMQIENYLPNRSYSTYVGHMCNPDRAQVVKDWFNSIRNDLSDYIYNSEPVAAILDQTF